MTQAITQLQLFNGALRILGERKLASLSEGREPQRVLTDIWNEGAGAVQAMLEKGLWKFAIRSQQLTYSPSLTPQFGYQYAFTKATDWVQTAAICSDPYYNQPITQYDDEANYLYCDSNTIYVKYVSNDASYGNDWTKWTQAFVEFFEAFLAMKSAARITLSQEKEAKAIKIYEKMGIIARNLDAMQGPAKFMPSGSWSGARRGRFTSRNRNDYGGGSW